MGRRASTDRDHAGHAGWRERTAAMAGAVAALAALALLASWVGGLLGPDPGGPADPDGLADAAALAGLGLFGLGCWLVPAAARRAGRLAGPARSGPGLLDALVLLTLACALGTAALALVLALVDGS